MYTALVLITLHTLPNCSPLFNKKNTHPPNPSNGLCSSELVVLHHVTGNECSRSTKPSYRGRERKKRWSLNGMQCKSSACPSHRNKAMLSSKCPLNFRQYSLSPPPPPPPSPLNSSTEYCLGIQSMTSITTNMCVTVVLMRIRTLNVYIPNSTSQSLTTHLFTLSNFVKECCFKQTTYTYTLRTCI